MPSDTADSAFVDVMLRPAFVLGVLFVVAFAYSIFVLQSVLLLLWLAAALASVLLTAFVVWLLYRLVVAVEDLAHTARRIETSLDE